MSLSWYLGYRYFGSKTHWMLNFWGKKKNQSLDFMATTRLSESGWPKDKLSILFKQIKGSW